MVAGISRDLSFRSHKYNRVYIAVGKKSYTNSDRFKMPEIFDKRRLVGIQAERVTNISSTDFPGHHVGENHSWNLKKFKKVR